MMIHTLNVDFEEHGIVAVGSIAAWQLQNLWFDPELKLPFVSFEFLWMLSPVCDGFLWDFCLLLISQKHAE